MKYELTTKTMTGKTVAESGACYDELEKFINLYGYNKTITYDKLREDFFHTKSGWISFLVDKGFLKKVEEGKTYTLNYGDKIKIDKSALDYVLVHVGNGNLLIVTLDDYNCWNSENLFETNTKYTKETLKLNYGRITHINGVKVV